MSNNNREAFQWLLEGKKIRKENDRKKFSIRLNEDGNLINQDGNLNDRLTFDQDSHWQVIEYTSSEILKQLRETLNSLDIDVKQLAIAEKVDNLIDELQRRELNENQE